MRGILGVVLVLLFAFFILSQAQRTRRNKEEANSDEGVLLDEEFEMEGGMKIVGDKTIFITKINIFSPKKTQKRKKLADKFRDVFIKLSGMAPNSSMPFSDIFSSFSLFNFFPNGKSSLITLLSSSRWNCPR